MKQRSRNRRIVIRAGIFLLLGTIVNVAVAWGCALWIPGSGITSFSGETADAVLAQAFGNDASSIGSGEGFGIGVRRTFVVGMIGTLDDVVGYHEQWTGLPFQSLTGRALVRKGDISAQCAVVISPELVRILASFSPSMLPLRPIWPGFAINTLFYAAILWLLLAAPFALRHLRRWRRLKRGLCPACAYPIGTSDLCTECGKPVNPRTALTP